MASFLCPHCSAPITDSPRGYVTGCEHYPVERKSIEPCKHLPIFDIVNNCDWCELCGVRLAQYPESERMETGRPNAEPDVIPGCPF